MLRYFTKTEFEQNNIIVPKNTELKLLSKPFYGRYWFSIQIKELLDYNSSGVYLSGNQFIKTNKDGRTIKK